MSLISSTIECPRCGSHFETDEDKEEHVREKHMKIDNKPDNWKERAIKWADAML